MENHKIFCNWFVYFILSRHLTRHLTPRWHFHQFTWNVLSRPGDLFHSPPKNYFTVTAPIIYSHLIVRRRFIYRVGSVKVAQVTMRKARNIGAKVSRHLKIMQVVNTFGAFYFSCHAMRYFSNWPCTDQCLGAKIFHDTMATGINLYQS